MTIFRFYVSLLILTSFVSCSIADKKLESALFYSDFKEEFLQGDLTKYTYNPRMQFAFPGDSNSSYRVLIRQDSSLLIFGAKEFGKAFNVRIDTFFKSDVILSKRDSEIYILTSPYNKDLRSLILKQSNSVNIVDYFLNLRDLLNKYNILEISDHPLVNTKEIVFSENDYLIYKPDSLIFKDSQDIDFMKYLFENGKQLDKNWYQFDDMTNTDYQ